MCVCTPTPTDHCTRPMTATQSHMEEFHSPDTMFIRINLSPTDPFTLAHFLLKKNTKKKTKPDVASTEMGEVFIILEETPPMEGERQNHQCLYVC